MTIIDTKEAASLTSFSAQHVRTLARERRIPHSRPTKGKYIFYKEELEKWMQDGIVPVSPEPTPATAGGSGRETGFYWVKYMEWMVCFWNNEDETWSTCYGSHNLDDTEWDEIDENIILPMDKTKEIYGSR